jgi:hypothetical protein
MHDVRRRRAAELIAPSSCHEWLGRAVSHVMYQSVGGARPTADRDAGSTDFGRIDTLEDLQSHLQCAIELEHAVLPPYLCALYTLDPVRNAAAAAVMRSIVVEEMLHLTLVANLLNATGGRPQFDFPAMLPGYPRSLPHGDPSLTVALLPFGPEALAQLLAIERPEAPGAAPQADGYLTIGQFYAAIRRGLIDLCARLGEDAVFGGDPGRQVTTAFAYGGGGHIVAVDSLATALDALAQIIEQGEGASPLDIWECEPDALGPEQREVAHYYRLHELQVGRRYRTGDTVASGPTGEPIALDPAGVSSALETSQGPVGSSATTAHDAFDLTYSTLLGMLDSAFDGEPETLGAAVGMMFRLKQLAVALMRTPAGGGATVGPRFRYVAPSDREDLPARTA